MRNFTAQLLPVSREKLPLREICREEVKMNCSSNPPLPPSTQPEFHPPSYHQSLNSIEDLNGGGCVHAHQRPPPSQVVSLALAPPSLHSVSPATSPSRQEEVPVELQGIPDSSPPPPYSPRRRWSIALSRASNSLQRNVAINRIHSPENAATLYDRIQRLHQESSSGASFLWSFGQILLSTIGCLAILIILLLVPLVILVVGIVFLNDCPAQPLVPLSLIIGGLAIILKIILLIVEGIATRNSSSISRRLSPVKQVVAVCCWRIGNTIFSAFLLAWTVVAGYFVFGSYEKVVQFGYFTCSEILYKFSFAVLILCGAGLLMWCFCLCMGCCCVSVSLHRARKSQDSSGEDVCNGDWVVGRGEGGVGRAGGGGHGAAEGANQNIRIQEVETEDDERSDVSYQELRGGATSNDESESSMPRNGVSVIRQVPVEVTMGSLDVGLVSVDERDEEVSIISSTLLPGMHLDSQDLDTASSRLGSMTLSSNRASYGYQFPEMTTFARGTSYKSQSLQRYPKTYSGATGLFGGMHAEQSQSSSSHMESTPYLPFKRHSTEHSAAALRNTTSSYVNLAPIPSVRYALTLSECARSNPQLYYKSPQRTLQEQQQKLQEAKTRSMDSHAARNGGRSHYPSMVRSQDLSRSTMREASLNGSSLYITVQSDGYSTTVV